MSETIYIDPVQREAHEGRYLELYSSDIEGVEATMIIENHSDGSSSCIKMTNDDFRWLFAKLTGNIN